MPAGKPAGARCAQLTPDNCCALFGDPRRPRVCKQFRAAPEICGASRADALRRLTALETNTHT
jgi:uncharacterized protein